MAGVKFDRRDRFAVFWGGGLGDVLVIRPLLAALEVALDHPPYFFTTSSHLLSLFQELELRTELYILPKGPSAALRVLREVGVRFDWLYLGPYPRIKTRLLARVVGAKRIWSRRHAHVHAFIGEQVLADTVAFGLQGAMTASQPYGGPWTLPRSVRPKVCDYLLLHPGAKDRWETTRWPDERWVELMGCILRETRKDLMLVGVPSERLKLEYFRERLEAAHQSRTVVSADLSLPELASAVEASSGVICHNSGILHLSAMLGKATLAITGSTAEFWRPPYPHVVNVTSGACGLACNQYRCPVPFFNAKCIRELGVEKVMDAARAQFLHTT